jgi:hypothetical protein
MRFSGRQSGQILPSDNRVFNKSYIDFVPLRLKFQSIFTDSCIGLLAAGPDFKKPRRLLFLHGRICLVSQTGHLPRLGHGLGVKIHAVYGKMWHLPCKGGAPTKII